MKLTGFWQLVDKLPEADKIDNFQQVGGVFGSDNTITVQYHILNPFVSLRLRINEQRPSLRILDNNTILDAQRISREASNLPVSYLHRVTECEHEGTCGRMRDLKFG